MSSQLGNWLDLSGTSNLYIQTYVKGFVDMSGGNLVLRNNSIYVNAGDVSMGGRLFVQGNAIFQTAPVMSGANITTGTIPASAISGGVQTNGMDLSTNQTAFGIKTFGNIITASAGIISYSDVSFGGNLVTKNIVGTSFNGGGLNQFNGITVTGTTLSIGTGSGVAGVDLTSNQTINGIKTFGNIITASGGLVSYSDVSLNTRLSIGSDVSINGNIFMAKLLKPTMISEIFNTNATTTTTYTFDYSTGPTFYISSPPTSNFTCDFTNIPADINRTYVATLIIKSTTNKFYCSTVKINSNATTFTPYFANGTPSINASAAIVTQTISIQRISAGDAGPNGTYSNVFSSVTSWL
jgi:hypothetical protein